MSGSVRTEKDGNIGWVVFDHRERRNAISVDMWRQIPSAVADLEGDADVRVVVLTGAGRAAFVSGADISEFGESRMGPGAESYAGDAGTALSAIAGVEKPVIALIHGFCFGGGVALALTADLRYAADDAVFAIPAARLGVGYHWAMLEALIDVVGAPAAKEILFTARRYRAEEALRIGLVNAVFAKDDLEGRVGEIAGRIAENAPLTLRSVKKIARELTKAPETRRTDEMDAAIRACFESEDYREGVAAFLEKRRPRFRGR